MKWFKWTGFFRRDDLFIKKEIDEIIITAQTELDKDLDRIANEIYGPLGVTDKEEIDEGIDFDIMEELRIM